jgi:hypothetical protein
VRVLLGVAAVLAPAARRAAGAVGRPARAHERLAEPEGEALLAHAARAVEEEAGGERAARVGVEQARAQRGVAVDGDEGHGRNMPGRRRGRGAPGRPRHAS